MRLHTRALAVLAGVAITLAAAAAPSQARPNPGPSTSTAAATKVTVRFKARSNLYEYTCKSSPLWRKWWKQGLAELTRTYVDAYDGKSATGSPTWVGIYNNNCTTPRARLRPGRVYTVTYTPSWVVQDDRCNAGKQVIWQPTFKRTFRVPAQRTGPLTVRLGDRYIHRTLSGFVFTGEPPGPDSTPARMRCR